MDVTGKVALVTGGGTGIGRATSLLLASKGAAVTVVDRNPESAHTTASEIVATGGRAIGVAADVSEPAGIRLMFDRCEAAFGGVDIVHNNAGLIGGEPLWPHSPLERIAAVIAVNLGGVAMGTQEAVLRLRKRGGGVIINTASTAALNPMPTDPVYSATKVGVVRIVESCTNLAAEGIRVNAVLPGVVDTDMTNKHTGDGTKPAEWLIPVLAKVNMLTPDDIAAAVLSLIEDDTKVGECRTVLNT
jgi:NAD(P)-dependent dehydrogenase (short-subunit alcohol dehydrogenase family)